MKCLCCESTFSVDNRIKNDLRRVYDYLVAKIHKDNVAQHKIFIDKKTPSTWAPTGLF